MALTPWVKDRATQLAVAGSILAGPSAAQRWWRIAAGSDRTYLYVGPHGNSRVSGVTVLFEHWITLDDLVNPVRLHTGRRGARRLVRLLRRSAVAARFAAERLLAAMLAQAGIRGWRANAPVMDGGELLAVGDFVFERLKLVVEVDGWAFHITPDRFQRDRAWQNRLMTAGWTVLRFTWRDLTERHGYAITTIQAMLARLSATAA